jgi:hypothetical protein
MGKGTFRLETIVSQNEWQSTTELIDTALAILEEQQPMTVRQLFYRLVSTGHLENTQNNYKKVSRIMTTARDDGRCDFNWIVDRSRPDYRPNVFRDPQQYAAVVKRAYRLDYWENQPWHCELWTEKDAIIGSIAGVTDELGVGVYVARGYTSTTKAHEAAQRLRLTPKPIHIFYLGDHDSSGDQMQEDIQRRVEEYMGREILMERLAIFPADIRTYKLPPQRIKDTDTRAARFRAKYGKEAPCVELDALPVTELRRRIQTAVEGLIDRDAWNRAIKVEAAEIKSIVETVSQWPGLNRDKSQVSGGAQPCN